MQGYNPGFARLYNRNWGGFAVRTAPLIRAYYEQNMAQESAKVMLDLCCGTGQLAENFLAAGYRTIGLDASEPMLEYASQNNFQAVQQGNARFLVGDASGFTLDEKFGLVVSTYDALNHLEDISALASCFHCVKKVLSPGGLFIFDLNTRRGLRHWNNVYLDDSDDDLFLVTRGFYDGGDKAWTKITGFLRSEVGCYERIDQTAYNTAFRMQDVAAVLLENSWKSIHFARLENLSQAVEDPEQEMRVFIVARDQ